LNERSILHANRRCLAVALDEQCRNGPAAYCLERKSAGSGVEV
jgi:hypothetical protein